jgi:hypothetical protein
MKQLVYALAVVSLSMMGCGGSLCEDFADTGGSIKEKVEDCPSFDDVTFDQPTDSEIKTCEENLDKCSDSDKKVLETFIECVNKLDKCTPSTEQAFSTTFVGCATPLQNVSDACGEATSSGVVRKGLAYSKAR